MRSSSSAFFSPAAPRPTRVSLWALFAVLQEFCGRAAFPAPPI